MAKIKESNTKKTNKKLKSRIDKVQYRGMNTTIRTYKIDNKFIGQITKDPYNNKYTIVILDHKKSLYKRDETKTLRQGIKIINQYKDI